MNNYSHAQWNQPNRAANGRQYFGNGTSLLLALILIFSAAAKAELQLNGSAIYEDLGKQQFVAALFVEDLSSNANSIQLQQSPKRMEVRIINDYSKRRWLNLWMQSISINNDRESFSGSAQEVIDIMRAPRSAPKRGDVIEYLFDRSYSNQQGLPFLLSNASIDKKTAWYITFYVSNFHSNYCCENW